MTDPRRQFLFDLLKEAEDDIFNPGGPLLWQCAKGLDDPRTWGSYKRTRLTDLEGREFEVLGPAVGHGDRPGILFTDVLFDPRTKKFVPVSK